jgi:DNA-binding XRE family transcriptional regulator
MSKRLKPTPEMEARLSKAIAEEERPEVIAANKARARQVFEEVEQRQLEFMDVLTALKEAREKRGLSLQDVCDKTGITRASLSLLENGKGNPTMTTLRRVAEAIGVEILVTVKG